jgi:hypothetical protein
MKAINGFFQSRKRLLQLNTNDQPPKKLVASKLARRRRAFGEDAPRLFEISNL